MEKLSADQAAVVDNLHRIQETIAEACVKAGRKEQEVTLMGVTKTVAPPLINAALDAGLRHIGENRVQEYLGKREELHLDGVTTYLIGHLQTNKVNAIVGEVDSIQSVDSLHVAQAIDRAAKRRGIVVPVLAEVNIGGEQSKTGASTQEVAELLTEMSGLSNIHVQGMMTIPPISDTSLKKMQYFLEMQKLFIDIRSKNIDNIDMSVLSMGMSDDYPEAVAAGATMVRVGSALFGRRRYV